MIDLAKLAERLMAFWKMQEPPHVEPPVSTPAPSYGTAGLRRNNPGNLRAGPQPWVGQTGTEDGFCVFDTPEHGLRALAKLLTIYQDRYSCHSIRAVITRWAPSSENNTAAYIAAVSQETGFSPDAWLHLSEPSVLAAMVKAIVHHENGQQPYPDSMVAQAVKDALG